MSKNKHYKPEDVVISEKDMLMLQELDDANCNDLVNLVVPLDARELRFLELYFGGMPVPVAARIAGYKQKSERTRTIIGKKVIAKYDSLKDHREIMLKMGMGPVRVTGLLLELAMNGKSENARIQALNIATKCLGMQRDVMEAGSGAEVIIRRTAGDGLESPEPIQSKEEAISKSEKKRKLFMIEGSLPNDDDSPEKDILEL